MGVVIHDVTRGIAPRTKGLWLKTYSCEESDYGSDRADSVGNSKSGSEVSLSCEFSLFEGDSSGSEAPDGEHVMHGSTTMATLLLVRSQFVALSSLCTSLPDELLLAARLGDISTGSTSTSAMIPPSVLLSSQPKICLLWACPYKEGSGCDY